VDERGQSTVEWVGVIGVVALLLIGLLAAGVRVPGADLARGIASRMLCAVTMADGCGDEPTLIATYGDEIGRLVRKHMPTILLENNSKALPVDFRRCRVTSCADGSPRGLVHLSDEGEHVTAFVHVVDCRDGADHGTADCSGERAGHLYIQYWLYYANSATFRGIPIAEDEGFHQDDWESVDIRIGADGKVDERASSHNGYNYSQGPINWGSDVGDRYDSVGVGPITVGALRSKLNDLRPHNGWGSETHKLLVSGGSHAGNAAGNEDNTDREVPGRRVHLVPLEPIAEAEGDSFDFGHITPPWLKHVWNDPESVDTS
jgi:hypothetical protein